MNKTIKILKGGIMMHLGFSYVGLIYLCMLCLPNIFWSQHKPQYYDQYVKNEKRSLLICERIGDVLVTTIVLIFQDFNIHDISMRTIWLGFSFLMMILYEIYWLRYFSSQQTMQDFYRPLFGIPVAGATLPVIAFFTLGIYGKNIF